VFFRSLGTDFYIVNTQTNRAWHVRTAENIQILDFHAIDGNTFFILSRNETKYFIQATEEQPNAIRRFNIIPIFTESLTGDQISSLITLSTHHFVQPHTANPSILAAVQTYCQTAEPSFDHLLHKKIPTTINSFIRYASTLHHSFPIPGPTC